MNHPAQRLTLRHAGAAAVMLCAYCNGQQTGMTGPAVHLLFDLAAIRSNITSGVCLPKSITVYMEHIEATIGDNFKILLLFALFHRRFLQRFCCFPEEFPLYVN